MQQIPRPFLQQIDIQLQSQSRMVHQEHNNISEINEITQIVSSFSTNTLMNIISSKKKSSTEDNNASHQREKSQQMPHIRTNQQEKLFSSNICPQCNKKFIKPAHLLRHVNQRHQNNRAFVCKQPQCGKTFKRDSHLRRHMISHSHQKSFKCTQCIMAFGYKHHLDRHIKSVHNKELLRCETCDVSFVKKKAFLKHFQKSHGNKTKQATNKKRKQKQNDSKEIEKIDRQIDTNKTKKIKKNKTKKSTVTVNEKKQSCLLEQKEDKDLIQRQIEHEIFEDSSVQEEEKCQQNSRQKVDCNQEKQFFEQKGQKINEEKLLFRCIHSDCVSAFNRMHQLMRHLKQRHQSEC